MLCKYVGKAVIRWYIDTYRFHNVFAIFAGDVHTLPGTSIGRAIRYADRSARCSHI